MSIEDLNDHERRRLETATESIGHLEASILRCQGKIDNLDNKRETLERAIISKREAIRRIKRVQAIAKAG